MSVKQAEVKLKYVSRLFSSDIYLCRGKARQLLDKGILASPFSVFNLLACFTVAIPSTVMFCTACLQISA